MSKTERKIYENVKCTKEIIEAYRKIAKNMPRYWDSFAIYALVLSLIKTLKILRKKSIKKIYSKPDHMLFLSALLGAKCEAMQKDRYRNIQKAKDEIFCAENNFEMSILLKILIQKTPIIRIKLFTLIYSSFICISIIIVQKLCF